MKFILLLIVLLSVSCSNQKLENYKNEKPLLNLKEFLNGNLIAKGIVQDRSGNVIKRFDVVIKASWSEKIGVIDEKFSYSDGSKSSRVWRLTEVVPDNFEGSAHDVVGVASGKVLGNVFHFQYNLSVPVNDKNFEINFDDWMYLLDSNTLLAKTQMSKWGINVGAVTLIMEKK